LIPQTFYFWKIKFLFFRPWDIFISRFSCLPVLLIVVVRVSRRGKAHMRFSVSRLKKAHLYNFICEYYHVFFINLAVNVEKLWKISYLSLKYISKSSLFSTINQEMFFSALIVKHTIGTPNWWYLIVTHTRDDVD
jgi:hypothetical protein